MKDRFQLSFFRKGKQFGMAIEPDSSEDDRAKMEFDDIVRLLRMYWEDPKRFDKYLETI